MPVTAFQTDFSHFALPLFLKQGLLNIPQQPHLLMSDNPVLITFHL
ncbi:hypothetical protein CLOSTHATH_00122 [Hungatella hathewayi DSM 13479]|uniref:Uncharacterized protein n=1 Tax=Hungatella hathewayi DSM 13479 TaxID=566550 RepID=D3A952_9FIRM|nr:hypothetical protein CLOSTHATH_00122 [Hungatella hathewayi DSM 13479]